jgi:hypothetical protein
MLAKTLVKKLPQTQKRHVWAGAVTTGVLTFAVSYWNYRQFIMKDFLRSEAHYRFNSRSENVTPWKQLYWTWWRMPKEEYNAYHRFKPYYIIG